MKKPAVLAFMLLKGGCGKTTVSINVAHAFALKKKRVLFIDADPQGNATATLGEYDNPMLFQPALAELFTKEATAGDLFCATKIDGLILVPNNIKTVSAIKGKDAGLEYMEAVKTFSAFEPYYQNFDYIIIDCPPDSSGVLPHNALSIADYVISPIDGVFALDAIAPLNSLISTFQRLINPRLKHLGFIMNKIKANTVNTSYLHEKLVEEVGNDLIFEAMIPESEVIKRSQSGRVTTFLQPKNKLTPVFSKIANEITRRIKRQEAAEENK